MSESKALAIIPRSIPEVASLAELITKSVLLPEQLRGKTADIIVSILAGQELGLSPMASIRGVHIISGKPVLAADTMMGICLGSGLAEYFTQVESSATSVTFETKRKGAPKAERRTWTIDDAKRAGIYKNVWLTYPRQMLAARCKAELARSVYPDVCAGVYDPDEITSSPPTLSVVPANHEQVADAEFSDVSLADQCAQAADMAALKQLVPALNKLPKGSPEREAAMTAYKARAQELELAAGLAASAPEAATAP